MTSSKSVRRSHDEASADACVKSQVELPKCKLKHHRLKCAIQRSEYHIVFNKVRRLQGHHIETEVDVKKMCEAPIKTWGVVWLQYGRGCMEYLRKYPREPERKRDRGAYGRKWCLEIAALMEENGV